MAPHEIRLMRLTIFAGATHGDGQRLVHRRAVAVNPNDLDGLLMLRCSRAVMGDANAVATIDGRRSCSWRDARKDAKAAMDLGPTSTERLVLRNQYDMLLSIDNCRSVDSSYGFLTRTLGTGRYLSSDPRSPLGACGASPC
jgi:hypothetical protein